MGEADLIDRTTLAEIGIAIRQESHGGGWSTIADQKRHQVT
jgi:hypothetical protein